MTSLITEHNVKISKRRAKIIGRIEWNAMGVDVCNVGTHVDN